MRAHVALLQATGQISGISWLDLIDFMRPESGVSVGGLISRRNAYAVIRNPHTTDSDILAGSLLYTKKCAECHGSDGRGSVAAPPLTGDQLKHGISDWAIYRTIRHGIANSAMAPHPLKSTELWQLVSFIRSLNIKTTYSKPKIREPLHINVPYEELRSLRYPSNDWLTYSGSYRSNRHSGLKQINTGNVHQLVSWN